MLNTEIASLMNEKSKMFDWATKVEYKRNMSAEETEISQVVDAWAKEIGQKGADPNFEISNYIVKTVAPEVYDVPDELLDAMFDRGTVGEFDDTKTIETPKNTLIAYDATKGGTVDKSYIDLKPTYPTWKHKQVETDITYVDLRRNGFKTIANLTVFAEEALKRKMFFDIFSAVDSIIAGGDQLINAGGTTPTTTTMDALALYLLDRGSNAFSVSLSKYTQAIARMTNQVNFMSDVMKDAFNKYGLVTNYGGITCRSISAAHKTGDNQLLLPDKRIFGIADKIGTLDMRGALRVYETPDNKREVIEIKVTGFEFGYCINKPEKVAKIVLS
jgi:hypothetical protein